MAGRILRICVGIALCAAAAGAATGSATFNITGNTVGTVTITLAAPGFIPANTALVASTATLGVISKNALAPVGWTKATITNGWKLTTPVTIATTQTLTGSTQAALTAKLLTPQSGIAWKVDAVTLTTADQLIATEAFGLHNHDLAVEIDNSVPAGTLLTNTINFTVTAQ